MMPSNDWLEPNIYNIADVVINELQQARCPHCRKPLTVPYRPNGFKDYQFCPFCGKRVSGKKTSIEAAAEILVKSRCPKDYGIEVDCLYEKAFPDNCTICWGKEIGDKVEKD